MRYTRIIRLCISCWAGDVHFKPSWRMVLCILVFSTPYSVLRSHMIAKYGTYLGAAADRILRPLLHPIHLGPVVQLFRPIISNTNFSFYEQLSILSSRTIKT